MGRSQRLTDGKRWRIFMRLLLLDELITSYTNARPGAGLLVVDLALGTPRSKRMILLGVEIKVSSLRFASIVAVAGLVAPAYAQWLHPDPRTPRTPDGKPILTAPAPRLNGKPDLSGVWQATRPTLSAARSFTGGAGPDPGMQIDQLDVADIHRNVFFGMKREEEPLKPEAIAVLSKRQKEQPPQVRCLPQGVPGVMMVYAFKMVQTPSELIVIGESQEPPRQIYLDGRGLPKDPDPSWMGYSVGKWENDTLVVQTTGFNEEGWLDNVGHPRGQSMLITERFRRRDFGHIDLEIRYEDSKYYTRPFTNKTTLNLIPDSDVIEFVCTENEKDVEHLGKR